MEIVFLAIEILISLVQGGAWAQNFLCFVSYANGQLRLRIFYFPMSPWASTSNHQIWEMEETDQKVHVGSIYVPSLVVR